MTTAFPIDRTHDRELDCWVAGANGHAQFPVQNLPLGRFRTDRHDADRAGTAIGDLVLDLTDLAERGLLPESCRPALLSANLNALLAQPAAERTALRRELSRLLTDAENRPRIEPSLYAASDCTMLMPCRIGDYTDFYVGIHHAMNVGRQFRPDNPLLPNYKHVPIGYHGRASSIRVSGEPVIRPNGQQKLPDAESPQFGPSRRLDYELELGVWIGLGNELGQPIPVENADAHVAGFCLLNDWSARDLQAWEYVPLGPFLAKNFHSTISPWIITAEAMAPFWIAQPERPLGDPAPLPYLAETGRGALSIELGVFITSGRMRAEGMPAMRLSASEARHMYWTVRQIVTHHASNGCNLQPGDLLGTGTISAPDRGGVGSLMELTLGGKEPVTLPTGETRAFLEDGDEVTMTGTAKAEGAVSISLGKCHAVILAAR